MMQKAPNNFFLRLKTGAALLVSAAIFAAVFEAAVSFLMLRGLTPGAPDALLAFFRGYYWASPYRHYLQFDPECAVYDARVFYRLKTGACFHSGARFRNHYSINSLGTRDDELSLVAPEIVTLGDSHTMGWGVAQEDSYPQLLERRTGRRVLNMGVSSFGTARELEFLMRADLRGLRYLVIQYNDNDLEENLAYLSRKRRPGLRPEEDWKSLSEQVGSSGYFPGAHLARMAVFARENFKGRRKTPEAGPVTHAWAFMSVLGKFLDRPELRGVKVLVFSVNNSHGGGSAPRFRLDGALKPLLSAGKFSRFAGRVTVLSAGAELDEPACRHLIDNHINAEGHRRAAGALLPYLAGSGAQGGG
ncbi:MAG TPA: hypothetical protein DEQ38_11865 [Elusimicrobia bacterium]|nr:MAG: hypothetical protein A2089_05305 [Elusimicrobia bacterium GWD2_63_28]HCC48794.1 hypothetical protein [Elusimicrobiota bacterium]